MSAPHSGLRVLVATIVHHPEDARILHREIRALVDRGHAVTYLAPFQATGTAPRDWVTPVDLPRAAGKRRWHAIRAARREIARRAADHDLVLLHDPELLLAVAGLPRPDTVWDVHEDTPASMELKPWLPKIVRLPASWTMRRLERYAEQRVHLLLAEDSYVSRFSRVHPVVPNATDVPERVPAPGDDRVIYVGALSRARGAVDLVAVARAMAGKLRFDVVGPADSEVSPLIEEAHREGVLHWHGYLPNDRALAMAEGAMAGLALLHDEHNYRRSLPTKVVEYMAHGVPVITTPNEIAESLVTQYHCGSVVPFGRTDEVVAALETLRSDPDTRTRMGANGHQAARAHYHWPVAAERFVESLVAWAGRPAALDQDAV